MDDFWHSIENVTSISQIPNCIKTIFFNAGYDTTFAIACIKETPEKSIAEVENYINTFGNDSFVEIAKGLECCYSELYANCIRKKTFKFLPGHKSVIMKVANSLAGENEKSPKERNVQSNVDRLLNEIERLDLGFPNILKLVIQTALTNSQQTTTNLNRYADILKYFAMYVYMFCGRQCYEILSSNLSLPAASTTGKDLRTH